MPSFGVTPAKQAALTDRMLQNGVREQDLTERFVSSGGPGGQHANRTATCVYLKHEPSGIEVKMQRARSQSLNRYYARKRLCELLEESAGDKKSPGQLKREKIRKQKARRRKRARKKVDDTPSKDDSSTS